MESWQNFIAMRNMSYKCTKKKRIVVLIVNLVSYINKIMCLFRREVCDINKSMGERYHTMPGR